MELWKWKTVGGRCIGEGRIEGKTEKLGIPGGGSGNQMGALFYAVSWFSRSLSAARLRLAASLSNFFCSARTSLE